jgi:endonuclease/exonuclease/phosphatase family metal-dependent hydrolase
MPLRILTQNLYNGRADPEALGRLIEQLRPDVIAVQELSANAARVLEAWGDEGLLDPRDDTTGMGMVLRGGAKLFRPEFPVRQPIVARLRGSDWDLTSDVQVVNAHLMNPIVRPLSATRRLRSQELAGLRALLATATPTEARIVVGDLNSSPAWPLYQQLRRIATDAAKQAGTAKRTWGPRPRSPRLLRIDHVFLAGPIRGTRTKVVRLAGADHSGLLVDIDSAR